MKYEIQELDSRTSEKKWLLCLRNKKYVVNQDVCGFIISHENTAINHQMLTEKEQVIFQLLENIGFFGDEIKETKSKDRARLIFKKVLFKQSSLKHLHIFKFLFSKPFLIIAISLIIFGINYAIFENKQLESTNFWLTIALLVPCAIFHEIGHISASVKYGLVPKGAGIGIYFTSPVVFVDVDDTWKLPQKQRIVVDVAGIYFQLIVAATYVLIYLFSHQLILLNAARVVMITAIFNLNPFLKFDGYWILSDILGVYNLNRRVSTSVRLLVYKLFRIKHDICLEFGSIKTYIIGFYAIFSTAFYVYFSWRLIRSSAKGIHEIFNNFSMHKLLVQGLFLFFAIVSIISLFKMFKDILIDFYRDFKKNQSGSVIVQ